MSAIHPCCCSLHVLTGINSQAVTWARAHTISHKIISMSLIAALNSLWARVGIMINHYLFVSGEGKVSVFGYLYFSPWHCLMSAMFETGHWPFELQLAWSSVELYHTGCRKGGKKPFHSPFMCWALKITAAAELLTICGVSIFHYFISVCWAEEGSVRFVCVFLCVHVHIRFFSSWTTPCFSKKNYLKANIIWQLIILNWMCWR